VEDPSSPASLVVILAAAVAAPVVAEATRRLRVPGVLFELVLGVLIGPQVLGWAEVTPFVASLSALGLAFLMFFAGYEIDLARIRGAPLNLAVQAWVASLVLGFAVAGVLVVDGFAVSDLLVGLALTTTAIGTLLPMLRDRGILPTPLGSYVLAGGSVGELGPIVAVTLLLSGDSPAREAALLVAFVVVAAGAAVLAARPQPPRVLEMLRRHLTTSTQLPVRVVVLLLGAMVLLAFELGVDHLLGAFTAGMLLRLAVRPDQAERLDPKLEALGFGFLIPVFFVVSGMRLDVDALADPAAMARVPVFLVLFLVVRGLPVLLLYRRHLDARQRSVLALLQATALPLVVVITAIGLHTGRMLPENAAALVGAGMLSVLVYPLAGFARLGGPAASGAGGEEVVTIELGEERP